LKEYIERDAARVAFLESTSDGDAVERAWCVIDEIPVADVVEVRHGRWIETTQPLGWCDETCAECSVCGEDFVLDEWGMEDMKNLMHYCPNCGAKMDGGMNDAAD
jgi:DNA-directed RNA polymerase subunit RPC12/RpoP